METGRIPEPMPPDRFWKENCLMFQFGMPTLLETKTIESCASLCGELGLSFIELNMNMPQYQTEKTDVGRLSEIAGEYGLYYTFHLDENFNPADMNASVAGAYVETLLRTVDLAKELRVPIINMHLNRGVYFTMPTERIFLFDEYADEYITRLTAFRDVCEQEAGDAGIKICIENTEGYDRPFLIKSLEVLLESAVFGLTFDIGHNAGASVDDEAIIMNYPGRLKHMHVHDAIGAKHHLGLGDGNLDIPYYLRIAKAADCRVVLETKTPEALRQSVRWLRDRKYTERFRE